MIEKQRTVGKMMPYVLLFKQLFLLATIAGLTAQSGKGVAADPASPQVAKGQTDSAVGDFDRTLEYRQTASPTKPYVRKLFTPGGVQILRDLVPDHKHHHGLMFALGVNGVDFWGEETGAGTEKPRDPTGTTIVSFLDAPCLRHIQTLDWCDTHGKQLLVERREVGTLTLKSSAPVTLVLWNSELSTAEGVDAVKLDGHHYYGLGMRFLKSMDSGGRFFNSAKQPGEIVRGSERLVAAKWCAYTAKADGKLVTVAIFDHPSNPRHPNKMFTMSPPFAYLSATLNLWKEPLALKAGGKLKLSYAVAAWDGEPSAEQIESLYEKWSNAKLQLSTVHFLQSSGPLNGCH